MSQCSKLLTFSFSPIVLKKTIQFDWIVRLELLMLELSLDLVILGI